MTLIVFSFLLVSLCFGILAAISKLKYKEEGCAVGFWLLSMTALIFAALLGKIS